MDKANKFALCCDLGLDKVIIYAFDAQKGTLTPHGAYVTHVLPALGISATRWVVVSESVDEADLRMTA